MSYHDLHIETKEIPRTSIFNLPFNLMLTCTRIGGWELWRVPEGRINDAKVIAGEYEQQGLRLDVNGVEIVNSLQPTPDSAIDAGSL